MKLKTFTDKAERQTFTYQFTDYETAQKASTAVLGYMVGTLLPEPDRNHCRRSRRAKSVLSGR